ncbi:hypothetical protein Tco_1054051 [Tanacetum coccineum]|uniref:Tf2-1-like SH3-like domain-containing protein n=1 Tax=Tanacetum coccineum TaxID=301880 RepID=A0ABQ5GWQ5_9ASTR
MQAAHDRQKSYADLKRKPMEFEVGDKVMLKVSPWKGVVRFGKRGKLNPKFVGPFKVIKRVGDVAYKVELPEELSRVHNTFHVSNLKKCHADEPLAVPLDGLHFDDKLQFVEEPIEITDREVKRLKRSRIPLVKVRWNSKRGPEFTWEREDQFRKKYPHLFTKTAPSKVNRQMGAKDALEDYVWLALLKIYSPGYIPESNPEEDPEEEDEEDPEEDPADYPADRGDWDDEESSDDDDECQRRSTFLLLPTLQFAYSAWTRTHLPCLSRSTARMSYPTPGALAGTCLSRKLLRDVCLTYSTTITSLSIYHHFLRYLSAFTYSSTTTPFGPTYVEGSLGSRAAGIRQRDALPSPVHENEMPEICLPLSKWPLIVLLLGPGSRGPGRVRQLGVIGQEICNPPTTLEGVNQRVIELATTVDQEDEIIYSQLDDARYDRALLRARVNMLYRDRPFHRRTALLTDEEARLSHAAWAQLMDACNQTHSEGISLRTTVMAQQSEITELQTADRRRQTVITDLLKADYQRQRQLVETLKIVKSLKTQMIELQRQQGPAKDPAEPELPEEASSSS